MRVINDHLYLAYIPGSRYCLQEFNGYFRFNKRATVFLFLSYSIVKLDAQARMEMFSGSLVWETTLVIQKFLKGMLKEDSSRADYKTVKLVILHSFESESFVLKKIQQQIIFCYLRLIYQQVEEKLFISK